MASVGGAYTHPSVYAAGARRELRRPAYEGALFFAGEAANVKCNPCMQGAVTTGLEAAAAAAAARGANGDAAPGRVRPGRLVRRGVRERRLASY